MGVADSGVFGGWGTERVLTFCSVDLSGQPSASYRHVNFCFGGSLIWARSVDLHCSQTTYSLSSRWPWTMGSIEQGRGGGLKDNNLSSYYSYINENFKRLYMIYFVRQRPIESIT